MSVRLVRRAALAGSAVLATVVAWHYLPAADGHREHIASIARSDSDRETRARVISASTMDEAGSQLRESLLLGDPVGLVIHRPTDATDAGAEKDVWSRRLTPQEVVRAKKIAASMQRSASRAFQNAEQLAGVQQEAELAKAVRLRATGAAVDQLLSKRCAFLLKSISPFLNDNEDWHYFNANFRTAEGDVWLYVPISRSDYPEVLASYDRSNAIRAYQRTEKLIEWNSRSYEDRQAVVSEAKKAKATYDELGVALHQLEQVPSEQRDESWASRRRDLTTQREAAREKAALVPPSYDPATLLIR